MEDPWETREAATMRNAWFWFSTVLMMAAITIGGWIVIRLSLVGWVR